MRWPNFIGSSYVSQSPISLGEELINFYVETLDVAGGKNTASLYPTPGFLALGTVTDSPIRALFAENSRVWCVAGSTLFEVFRNGTALNRGAVARDSYPATISSNGAGQLFITSGDQGYCLNITTNVLTNVLASGATMGACVGGFFLAFNLTLANFRISDFTDGLTWQPSQFADRTLAPDPWRSMLVVNGRIYLLGENTTEVWYLNGASPFPFAPVTTNVIQYGIAAPFAAAQLQDTATWLAHTSAGTGLVVQTRGIAVQEIQTHAVAWQFSRYSTIEDCLAWTYQDQGHPWVVFDFPSAGVTWAVDGNDPINSWHKRGEWSITTGTYTTWGPSCHCHEWNVHLVGDRNSGTIWQMDVAYGTDMQGAVIRRLRRPPALFRENQRIALGTMELFLEAGLGLANGQGSDPQVLMRLSGDGGQTWGNWRSVSAGKIGEYSRRVLFNRNGVHRDPVPEFVVSDPVPWRLTDLFVTVKPSARARQAA